MKCYQQQLIEWSYLIKLLSSLKVRIYDYIEYDDYDRDSNDYANVDDYDYDRDDQRDGCDDDDDDDCVDGDNYDVEIVSNILYLSTFFFIN